MDPDDENFYYHYNNNNEFATMDFKKCKEKNDSRNSRNYYHMEMDKVVNRMKRYSCTCLSHQRRCKTHDTNQIEPTQRFMVPLNRSNRRTHIDTINKQAVPRVKKFEKVIELSETEWQKKRKIERENFRGWLLDKAKQNAEKIKKEKLQLLKKQRDAEEKKKIREAEGELRYKLWLKEKEQENLMNKIKEQMEKIKAVEEKQKRLQKSEEAYKQWLLKSANKSKPVPHSKDLDSKLVCTTENRRLTLRVFKSLHHAAILKTPRFG